MELLAFVSGNGALDLLIQLVVAGVVFFLVVWFLGWINLAEPFLTVAKVIIGLFALIFLINLLSGLGGTGHRLLW